MLLSDKQKGDLVRLFSDEGLIDTVRAICEGTAMEYKERAFRFASSSEPELVAIAQEACKGYAFENILVVLQAEFDAARLERTDDESS